MLTYVNSEEEDTGSMATQLDSGTRRQLALDLALLTLHFTISGPLPVASIPLPYTALDMGV